MNKDQRANSLKVSNLEKKNEGCSWTVANNPIHDWSWSSVIKKL